jgi:hypothetical protein
MGEEMDQRAELSDQRHRVDFDTYDVTVDELVRRVENSRIEIAPIYQRQFRWESERQSALIESIYLGIPVPPLFMATNVSASFQNQWEVVDGLQRLASLVNFVGSPVARARAGLEGHPLALTDLKKLKSFSGFLFSKLSDDLQTTLLDRPVKVIVLNDKSDTQVRFDLFERLNTGGLKLTDQEIRECVFRGDFIDLLVELAQNADFRKVAVIPESAQRDGTPEEWVLRFFAFVDKYSRFDHSVKDFLNGYTEAESMRGSASDLRSKRELFENTFRFLAAAFPQGITRGRKTTPVNLFEGVSVGAALALKTNQTLSVPGDTSALIADPGLKGSTTGATNSRVQVARRIEISRDFFVSSVA